MILVQKLNNLYIDNEKTLEFEMPKYYRIIVYTYIGEYRIKTDERRASNTTVDDGHK